MTSDLISRSALGIGKAKRECFEDPKYADGWNSAVEIINNAPAVDAVERKKLIKKMFPMGVPNTREEWNYSINARAVYEAIMKTEG